MLSHNVAHGRSLTDSDNSAKQVLSRWRDAGIPYCTLRASIEGEAQGGDLDLLVEESSVDKCRKLLEQDGFVAAPGRSPFKMVVLRYRHGQLLCFDIHWKAVQYGIVYMDAGRMLARRIETDGVFHLSAEDELIHLVVHNFLRKGPLRPASLGRIKRLLKAPLDRTYLNEHLDSFGLRPAFETAVRWVERDDAGSAADVRKQVFRAALRARAGNVVRHLKLRCHVRAFARRRGGLVALVGPDGSGKSTVIRTLVERARAIPNLKIATTYLGPWGQLQLPLVRTLRRAGVTPTVRPIGPHLATQPRRARSWIGSLVKGHLFYAAIYIELVYRYVTSVFFRVRKGQWVVADRYITDLRYLYKERPIGNYAAIRRLLPMLFPKPDLLIVLDNRPDVIVSRKTGLAAGQIEVLRQFNLKAAQSYRFEVVTTDRAPEEIADHILNRMLSLRAFK